MPSRNRGAGTPLDRLRKRYERTETKCPACGYVDDGDNWTSRPDGKEIVYVHTCPSCGAQREYTFEAGR